MSNYVTAIGLDVHARSISACAFDPMTGEVVRARFGYDPASVAEWALGFESPKAVYESGPRLPPLPRPARPRPRLRGGRRLQDAAPGRRPGRNDRRDADARQAPRLPQRRRGAGARRAHRGGPRPLPRARGRARRPAARQAAHVQVPARARPGVRRDDAGRATQVEPDRGVLGRWARSIEFGEADDAAACERYMDAVERCAEAKRELERKVEESAARPEWASVVDALCLVKGIDVASAFLLAAEAGDFSRFPTAPSFASWCWRSRSARAARPSRAAGSPARAAPTRGARSSRRRGTSRCRRGIPRSRGRATGSRRPCRGTPRSATAACRTGGRHVPGGQEAVRGELRDGPRDGLLGLGDSAHGPVAPAAP